MLKIRPLFHTGCLIASISLLSISAFAQGKGAQDKIPEQRAFPVNPAINPCQNFYQYTCSVVNSSYRLPDDRSRHVFSFDDSSERLLDAKGHYLASLTENGSLSNRARALKNNYVACMNKQASAHEERQIVNRILREVTALRNREQFKQYLEQRIDTADFSFLDFGTVANLDDPDWDDVYFAVTPLSLPEKSYYRRAAVLADLSRLADALFAAVRMNKPGQRTKWLIDFEKQLAEHEPTPAEIRRLQNARLGVSPDQFAQQYPSLRVARFLKQIPKRTLIRNITPDSFEFLNTALDTLPLKQLKSVYLFHALSQLMDDAYPDYFKQRFAFKAKHLGGPKARRPRKERCTKRLMDSFSKELDAELLPVLFPDFPEQKFGALVERVRASIIQGIEKNDWLSDKTKAAAIRKVKHARLQLVKPQTNAEWNFNPPAEYSPDKPHQNSKILVNNLIKKTIRELHHPRDKNRWDIGPLTVNAYYTPSDNKFVVAQGILQYPFYDPELPEYANLGASGMVAAHELGHAIDDQGSKYDDRGRLRQWMTDDERQEFQQRGAKLVEQFEKAVHNGELTLGENIADLVGLSFAYRAAFPTNTGTKKEKQAFFVQYARNWCTVIRPKFRQLLLKTDPHAMGPARVNEQVKHQPGFQEAFGCVAGDPMVLPPEQRVRIW